MAEIRLDSSVTTQPRSRKCRLGPAAFQSYEASMPSQHDVPSRKAHVATSQGEETDVAVAPIMFPLGIQEQNGNKIL
jgi:hypothetical protein